jgi:hypothetical protein
MSEPRSLPPSTARSTRWASPLGLREVHSSSVRRFAPLGDVGVETPGYPPEVSQSDGTEVKLTDREGDESKVSQRFVEGALVQQGRTDQGKGQTQFTLQPEGRRSS